MIRAVVALGVSVVVGGFASEAWAKPRVVLAKIDGDAKGSVYDAVSSSLETELSLVAWRDVKKAFTKLEIDDLSDAKDVGRLEKAVSAQAVITGSLDQKSEGAMALHLKIYVKPATKPKAFTVKFSNATSEKFRKTVHDTIITKLGDLPDDGEDAAGDPPKKTKKKKVDAADGDDGTQTAAADDPSNKKKKKKAQPAEDDGAAQTDATPGGDDGSDPPKKKKKKKVAAEEPDDGGGGGGDDDKIVATVSLEPAHSANHDAVRVNVGTELIGRTLSFNSRPNFPQAPKPYTNVPVPGAYVDGELYPFAFSNPKSFAAGLGVGFSYEKTLALQLRTTDPNSGNVLTATANQQNYEVDARYRIPIGKSATAPSLTLSIGYGQRAFIVGATGANRMSFDIPDVVYTAVLPQVSARIPFGSHVALYGGGGVMLITDAGPIEGSQSYGQGKVIGLQANAGLDITFGNRFGIRIEGDYAQVGFAFVGNGVESIDRDNDPTTIDVGGAADVYYGGTVTFGVFY
jgi:hypothetical protein